MSAITRRYNQNWLPSIFNDFFDNDWMARTNVTAPAINVLENETGYEIELAAPGMTKDDFKVSLDDNGDLVINMEKKEENNGENNEEKKHGRYLRREFSYTKFQQTMVLPEDVEKEKISATVVNGVLKVEIPKQVKQEVPQAKKIIEIK
jgi:HSP20 family protein